MIFDSDKKKLITEMFDGWYMIDNILFGSTPTKYLREGSLEYATYLDLKKVFLTTLCEFYQHIGYKSPYSTLPRNSKQVIKESRQRYNVIVRECCKELRDNKEKYIKLISEGLNHSDSRKVDSRLSSIKMSMLFNKCFMETAQRRAINQANMNDVRGIILTNCLTEARKELISLSKKYYSHF